MSATLTVFHQPAPIASCREEPAADSWAEHMPVTLIGLVLLICRDLKGWLVTVGHEIVLYIKQLNKGFKRSLDLSGGHREEAVYVDL